MTEPSSASEKVPSVGLELDNLPVVVSASNSSSGANKRSSTEAFEGDSIEDLNDQKTTLDDVSVPRLTKKSKLLDEELPDVDDNEEFPLQTEEMDENLALSLENGENGDNLDPDALFLAPSSDNITEKDLNLVTLTEKEEVGSLNDEKEKESEKSESESEEKEEKYEEKSDLSTSINNEIDIVDVEEEEEEEEYSEEEEEEETMRAIARAQNQKEARELLLQLDDSTRSKLCLTAMEKYGEELFYGHEDARDAILVDACAQDSILSLMRDAIRVKELYLRGSSAAEPLELDDDEDEEEEEQEGEDEVGGYEDEEEDADEEEEEQSTGSIGENDDEIVVISEEEEGEKTDMEASSSRMFSSEKVTVMPQPHSAGETGCDTDPNDGYKGDHSEQGTMEGEALGNTGAASDSAVGLSIDEEGSSLPVMTATPES